MHVQLSSSRGLRVSTNTRSDQEVFRVTKHSRLVVPGHNIFPLSVSARLPHNLVLEAHGREQGLQSTATIVTETDPGVNQIGDEQGAAVQPASPAKPEGRWPQLSKLKRKEVQDHDVEGLGKDSPATAPSSSLPARPSSRVPSGAVCSTCGGRETLVSAKGALAPCPSCSPYASRLQLPEDFDFDFDLLDEELDRLPIERKGKARKPLTEEHRNKIRQALKKNEKLSSPKSDEHKQRISRAMRRANDELARARKSQALTGRAKRCSLCGDVGHNRATCPQNPANTRKNGLRQQSCSVCGEVGHNKLTCSVLVDISAANSTQTIDHALPQPDHAANSSAHSAQERSSSVATTSSATSSIAQTGKTGKRRSSRKKDIVFPLPVNTEEAVEQAVSSIVSGIQAGYNRQSIELLFGSSSDSADGWPGGIRQQFRAALPVVEALLLRLKQVDGLQGTLAGTWMDQTDCVGLWQNEHMAAVLFPTATTVGEIKKLTTSDGDKRRLVITINPQWNRSGQVVSDFGFGQSRREAERFIDSFLETYSLRRVSVMGDDVALLKPYPGQWQVFYLPPNQPPLLLSREALPPSYARIMGLLKSVKGSRASLTWFQRVLPRAWDAPHPILQFYQQASKTEESYLAMPSATLPEDDETAVASGDEREGDRETKEEVYDGQSELLRDATNRFHEVDIITGEVVRDVKLDPIKQLIRWLP